MRHGQGMRPLVQHKHPAVYRQMVKKEKMLHILMPVHLAKVVVVSGPIMDVMVAAADITAVVLPQDAMAVAVEVLPLFPVISDVMPLQKNQRKITLFILDKQIIILEKYLPNPIWRREYRLEMD